MDTAKKAKMLLEENSFMTYIESIFFKYRDDILKIYGHNEENLETMIEEYEEALIKTNWTPENREDFIIAGYTMDDIEYEDEDELAFDLKIDLINDMTQTILIKYFDNDKDLFNDIKKYITETWNV